MATCLDCAKIASAAYYTGAGQWDGSPPGHMVDGWTVQHWETGTLLGNGFQGGIWQTEKALVVGFCGTNPDQGGKVLSDLTADLRVAFKILPNQASSAHKMTVMAKEIAHGRPVLATGHSLGGALAQIVGVWDQVRFVTFNAPPMAAALCLAQLNALKPMMAARTIRSATILGASGSNFIVKGDFVSRPMIDWHIGETIELAPAASGSASAHSMATIYGLLERSEYAKRDAFSPIQPRSKL